MMSFEEAMMRIDEISAEMAKPDLALDTSLSLYKEAIGLIAKCREYIEGARLTVEKLGAEG